MIKLCFLILITICSCHAISEKEIAEEWQNFQVKFRKTYDSPVEATKRFNIFKEKLVKIEEHNAQFSNGSVSWKKGINKFSDLNSEEFQDIIRCVLPYENSLNRTVAGKLAVNERYPKSKDWRKKRGVLLDVRDEEKCRACWAFTATEAITAQFKIQQSDKVILSPQNLIDCVNKDNGYESDGCNGGYIEEALAYAEIQGVSYEKTYPYEDQLGKCRQTEDIIKIMAQLPVPPYEKNLLGILGLIGPVIANMEVTDDLQDYSSGVFYNGKCTEKLNHAVLIVGYGTENGDDYLLVKNSWGKLWGEGGYFKINRKNGSCGILNNSLFAAI